MHKKANKIRRCFFIKYNQRLKNIREDRDYNQETIAKIIKTTQQYYGKYENGKREIPFSRAIEIAKFYNISLDYIAGLIDEPRTIDGKQTTTFNKNVKISNKGNNNKFNIKQKKMLDIYIFCVII